MMFVKKFSIIQKKLRQSKNLFYIMLQMSRIKLFNNIIKLRLIKKEKGHFNANKFNTGL